MTLERLAELGEPLMILTAEEMRRLRSSLVYVWSRGEEVLYVGCSFNGIERPLAKSHNRLHDFQPGDTLTIWPAADPAALELDLITRLRPSLNGGGPFGNQGKPCPECGRRWRLVDRPAGRCKWCQRQRGVAP